MDEHRFSQIREVKFCDLCFIGVHLWLTNIHFGRHPRVGGFLAGRGRIVDADFTLKMGRRAIRFHGLISFRTDSAGTQLFTTICRLRSTLFFTS